MDNNSNTIFLERILGELKDNIATSESWLNSYGAMAPDYRVREVRSHLEKLKTDMNEKQAELDELRSRSSQ